MCDINIMSTQSATQMLNTPQIGEIMTHVLRIFLDESLFKENKNIFKNILSNVDDICEEENELRFAMDDFPDIGPNSLYFKRTKESITISTRNISVLIYNLYIICLKLDGKTSSSTLQNTIIETIYTHIISTDFVHNFDSESMRNSLQKIEDEIYGIDSDFDDQDDYDYDDEDDDADYSFEGVRDYRAYAISTERKGYTPVSRSAFARGEGCW